MRANSLSTSETIDSSEARFEDGAYLACLSATLCFASQLAMQLNKSSGVWSPDAQLWNAVLVGAASVTSAVSATFELRSRLRRNDSGAYSLPLLAGLCVGFVVLLFLGMAFPYPEAGWLFIAWAVLRAGALSVRLGFLCSTVQCVVGAVIGYWSFLLTYVDGYKLPWVSEAVHTGTAHVDLLFHAAITNMLTRYGVGSLGVDGLAPFPYHFGSHHVVTVLYRALDIGPLQFYSVVFPLLFCPVFFVFLFFFALSYRSYLRRTLAESGPWEAEGAGWFWTVFAILFIGLLPLALRRTLGVWDNVFHSESFGMAVLASYLAGVWFLERMGRNGVGIGWYAWPVFAAYLVVLCLLKVSVGLVVGTVGIYLLARLPLSARQRALGGAAILLALLYGLLATRAPSGDMADGPSLLDMIKPMAFMRDIIQPGLRWQAFFSFFGALLLLVLVRVWPARGRADTPFRVRLMSGRLIDLEMAVVLTFVSIAPGLILSVPQGGTNFFAEVSYWWVQPMAAVALGRLFASAAQLRHRPLFE